MPEPSRPRLIHEFDPHAHAYPRTAQEAVDLLLAGNETIRGFHDDCRVAGEGRQPSGLERVMPLTRRQVGLNHLDDLGFPRQAPWAVFLGCADARVPSELLFGQGFNDLFDIRVAGNVLSDESAASLIFALRHFTAPIPEDLPRVRLAVVLGHRGCGAVKAVVEHFQAQGPGMPVAEAVSRLGTSPLENLMRRIYPAFAEVAAGEADPWDPSRKPDLIEAAVVANVRMTAEAVSRIIESESAAHPHAASVTVAYGAYDPFTFEVSDHAFTTVEKAMPSRERKSRLGLVAG